MDFITLAQAKKYAKALIDALDLNVEQLGEDVGLLEDDVIIVDADGDLATTLIMNRLRQHIWQNEDDALICEDGTVSMTNTQKFPFNDSQKTVALVKTQKNTKYVVIVDDVTAGNVGDIVVTDKQVNGFKIGFTGSASSVKVTYSVIGGYDQ